MIAEIKAITKAVTGAYAFYVIHKFMTRLRQSIMMRLSLPMATPKLSRNYSLRSQFWPDFVRPLTSLQCYVSLSIEEDPNLSIISFNIKINSLSLFGFNLFLRSCVPQGNHSFLSKQVYYFFLSHKLY
jgi:hypothetical protein